MEILFQSVLQCQALLKDMALHRGIAYYKDCCFVKASAAV
jgi:hypothetical protein